MENPCDNSKFLAAICYTAALKVLYSRVLLFTTFQITELRKRSKSNERKRIQRSPPFKSEMTSEMNLADNSIIEVGNPIPASESKSVEPLIYGSNPTTNVLSKSQDAEEMNLESSVNINTILSNEKLSFLKVSEADTTEKKVESCDKATNAVSGDKSTQSLEGNLEVELTTITFQSNRKRYCIF